MLTTMHVRKANGGDVPLVKDSWLRSYASAWHVKRIPPATYRYYHGSVLDRLLVRGTVLMATDPADPWVVWGWICGEWDGNVAVVHYVYVKDAWRKLDIATHLVRELLERNPSGQPAEAVCFTHDTKCTKHFIRGLEQAGVLTVPTIYNPYLMYEE